MGFEHERIADLYDQKLDYISAYGRGVVELLEPQRGERILDLGCGTGDLAQVIARSGADVVGIDLSEQMIDAARHKYPHIAFHVADGEDFDLGKDLFDAVFSNAALHWMKRPTEVLRCVHHTLRPGGRFVAEFGGQGNIEQVVTALSHVLTQDFGIDPSTLHPWYFPSLGTYSVLLEQQGFHVSYAEHFARPTRLPDEEKGLQNWLAAFASTFLAPLSAGDQERAVSRVIELCRDALFRDGAWHVDYYRLRIRAVK